MASFVVAALVLLAAPAVLAVPKSVAPSKYTSGDSSVFYARLDSIGLYTTMVPETTTTDPFYFNAAGQQIAFGQDVPIVPPSSLFNIDASASSSSFAIFQDGAQYSIGLPNATLYVPSDVVFNDTDGTLIGASPQSSVIITLPGGTKAIGFQLYSAPAAGDSKTHSKLTITVETVFGVKVTFPMTFGPNDTAKYLGLLSTSKYVINSLLYITVSAAKGYTTSGINFAQFELAF